MSKAPSAPAEPPATERSGELADEAAHQAANGPFVLAHLSDPHVPSRLAARPMAMFNKRVFGYLSWRFRRVRIHRREVLDALRSDLASAGAHHTVITGDIVNIALPSEFSRAGDWLKTLGSPGDITVVPGNHDAYVAVHWDRSWAAWHEFMSSDADHDHGHDHGREPALADRGADRLRHQGPSTHPVAGHLPQAPRQHDRFPIVRRRGPLALIGLSTAVPTRPGHASGEVGRVQLDRLAHSLEQAGARDLFRVVLLHHPPGVVEAPMHKRLTDAEGFRAVIAQSGAELVLHGHEHRFRFGELRGPNGPVPVFGVPSASMLPRPSGAAAQYHLHRIERRHDRWLLETRIHTYQTAAARFVTGKTMNFELHRSGSTAAAETCYAPRAPQGELG